jgi:outer membrane PBP1 activator LpoA protein
MSRFKALVPILVLVAVIEFLAAPRAFSADPPPPTRRADEIPIERVEDIDPATGLSRTTVVRPLREFPGAAAELGRGPSRTAPGEGRRHIALILPTTSPTLGRLAEAVRLGFVAAIEAGGRELPTVTFIPIENEGAPLLEACREAQRLGAVLVVAGLTRDGATALARSDCPRLPVLALNEPQGFVTRGNELGPGDLPANLFHITLSLEQEARQVALQAVADGWHSAIVITSPSPLARRVQEAFEREWIRAAGELRRVSYSGNADDAPLVRDRIATTRGDMVFLALDQTEARAVRPYVSGALPVYATSMSVDPRADPAVNVDLQGVRYLDMPWFVQPDHAAVMVYPIPKGSLSVEEERLYALGIDAFRLGLLILRGDPARVVLDGVTGKITLGGGNAFVRALPVAEVDGGRVVPAKSSP